MVPDFAIRIFEKTEIKRMQLYVAKVSRRTACWTTRHMSYKIVTLPGDGVGPEVTEETLKVLSATSIQMETQEHLIGGVAIDEVGEPFPRGKYFVSLRNETHTHTWL